MSNRVQELLEELDMESWLDYEGVKYKRTRGKSGLQLNIRECPACGNNKYKVYCNAETGLGNCFVCSQTFTKWKFVACHLNIPNKDVFNYLESYVGSQTAAYGSKAESIAEEPKPELLLPDSVPLPINGKNLKYLEDRNVTAQLAAYYELRYCHRGIFKFVDGYGKQAEQNYAGRVIIPIFDIDGSFVSFQGRDITGTQARKYLFPPQFASTGSILYDAHRAFSARTVVIGEGVFDAIAIKAALDTTIAVSEYRSIASFGKSLGMEQLERLKRLQTEGSLEEVIFMWDGEQKAIEAAVDAAMSCRSHGIKARVAVLPNGCDPNEVSIETVLDAIKGARVIDALSAIRLKLEARSFNM